jgi:hypothetical protein
MLPQPLKQRLLVDFGRQKRHVKVVEEGCQLGVGHPPVVSGPPTINGTSEATDVASLDVAIMNSELVNARITLAVARLRVPAANRCRDVQQSPCGCSHAATILRPGQAILDADRPRSLYQRH